MTQDGVCKFCSDASPIQTMVSEDGTYFHYHEIEITGPHGFSSMTRVPCALIANPLDMTGRS